MDTTQKLAEAKIAAEDLIVDLEKVIDRANAALIRRPAREIHAESPELFEVQLAIVRTSAAAADVKARLLKAAGLEAYTRLTRLPAIVPK
jgi:hypothetical protein